MQPDETVDLDQVGGPASTRPDRLGPWKILSLRRRSETVNTYVAQDPATAERVRVAVLHRGLAEDPEEVARFKRLARIRERMNHPHLVTGVTYGESDGFYYVTMEHPTGERLASLLRDSGALRQAPALGIAMQVLRGVAHIHTLGTIHGRVKASNVLVLPDGRAKLGGLAAIDLRAIDRHLRRVETPASAPGPTPDIYGIGFLLLQMLTGNPRPLHEGEGAVLEQSRIRLPDASSSHTLQTDAILWRCLADKANARYRTFQELADAIQAALQELLPEPAMESYSATSTVPLAFETDATGSAMS